MRIKYSKVQSIVSNKIHIKSISSQETYSVRHPVLRTGKPLESCHMEGDDLDSTLHFGLYLDSSLIGVASFMGETNSIFQESKQSRLRGMAILKDFQGKGLGNILLNHAEKQLKNLDVSLIWCNARETAIPFYEKQGYQKHGIPFDIKEIGIHYVMFKKLQQKP